MIGLAETILRQPAEREQAAIYVQRASRLLEHEVGDTHFQLIDPINSLASLACSKGDYLQAETLILRGLAIWKMTVNRDRDPSYQPSSPLVVPVAQSRESYQLVEQAIEMWEQEPTHRHYQIGYALMTLLKSYQQRQLYTAAEQIAQHGWRIGTQALGEHHPLLANWAIQLAEMSLERDQFQQAEQYCQQAEEIIEKTLKREHPLLTMLQRKLADLYQRKEMVSQIGKGAETTHDF
ncbi:tetratricopeptide repeat protein [Dictyobacter arantiisoli]|uniref:MalT-like TPR region domain-containing protein n=1 Tax=Dictyobacter arantiisoli TaxID=2014874 RepID=A0A5A5TKV4_9CHLR|nr:tetratricopeptide repeat protein [Dictyobacter arantiisoli]GCF11683.1 hypothetical protein KDI_52470 [Dictyobacter arantiisoli]